MLSMIHTENQSPAEFEPMLEFPLKILDHYVKGHSDTAFSAKPYSTAKFRPG